MGQMVDCDVSLGYDFGATPEDVSTRASGHSDSIRSEIDGLMARAVELRESADSILESVSDFETAAIDPIEFEAALGEYDRRQKALPVAPDVFELGAVDPFDADAPPELRLAGYTPSQIDSPDPITVTFVDAPERPSAVVAPDAPDVGSVTVPDAPDVNVTLGDLPQLGAAPAFSGSFPDIQSVELPDLPLDEITLPDDSVLDRLETLAARKFERSEYEQRLLPETMTAVGALLEGNFILDMDELEAGVVANIEKAVAQYARRMQSMWSRRGWDEQSTDHRREHIDRVLARVSEDQRKDWTAAVTRWRMQLLPVALQLNVEAHSFATEMLGELYDLDFNQLEAEYQAQISLFDLAAARYNIVRLKMEKALTEYRIKVARVRASAQVYSAYIRQQEAVADMNQARGQAYSAEQEAQMAAVDVFRAQVDAAEAVIEAYNSMMRGVAGKAEALKVKLAEYEASTTEWGAELTSARAEFDTARSENRAITARNRARAAQVGADAATSESVAFAAVQSAAETSAQVAQLKAQAATRVGQYATANARNDTETLQYTAQIAQYRREGVSFDTSLIPDRADFSAIGTINSEVASTVQNVAQTATRAAELTQQYRSALADAYVSLYGAAADAESSRVTGRVSGYRASVGLATRGSVDYTSQIDSSSNYSEDVSASQGNSCQTLYEPARY